ncbi:MAG: hypothetical protein O7B30_07255 [Thaumarchaeota archaeon]|nr:hypothetical protein [Nitrososphaerota archaeon]
MLQAGAAGIVVGLWIGFRQNAQKESYKLGFRVAQLGAILEVIAGVWNEIWHIIYLTEPIISPPHALLVIGMMSVIVGMAIGMTQYYHKISIQTDNRKITLPILSALLMMFTSIWLVSSGSVIYVAGITTDFLLRSIMVGLLSVISTLVIIPVLWIIQKKGSVTVIVLTFNLINWIFLVPYVGNPPYFPYGVFTFVIEPIYLLAKAKTRSAIVLIAGVLGLLSNLAYFPFSVRIYSLPGFSIDQILLISISGGILGGVFLAALVAKAKYEIVKNT